MEREMKDVEKVETSKARREEFMKKCLDEDASTKKRKVEEEKGGVSGEGGSSSSTGGVKRESREEAGAETSKRKVEDSKGDVVRFRFVVKQIAYDYGDDVSQSTPALFVFRMMLAFASSKCPLFKAGSNFFIASWDISAALMQRRSTS